ncbi:MAG: hypothetical protein Kow0096_11560 [Thiohalomonadaceae bacterium]
MTLPTDPHLLYSLVNMKLRNDYADLDDLVRSLGEDEEELVSRLLAAGYIYDAALQQFRAAGAEGRLQPATARTVSTSGRLKPPRHGTAQGRSE